MVVMRGRTKEQIEKECVEVWTKIVPTLDKMWNVVASSFANGSTGTAASVPVMGVSISEYMSVFTSIYTICVNNITPPEAACHSGSTTQQMQLPSTFITGYLRDWIVEKLKCMIVGMMQEGLGQIAAMDLLANAWRVFSRNHLLLRKLFAKAGNDTAKTMSGSISQSSLTASRSPGVSIASASGPVANGVSPLGISERSLAQRPENEVVFQNGLGAFREYVFRSLSVAAAAEFVEEYHNSRFSESMKKEQLGLLRDLFVDMGKVREVKQGNVVHSQAVPAEERKQILGFYNQFLFAPLCAQTDEYLKKASVGWVQESSVAQYLDRIEAFINAEENRSIALLDPSSHAQLLNVVRVRLLSDHLDWVLNDPKSGFMWLLQNDQLEVLSRLNRLLRFVDNGMERLGDGFRSFIIQECDAIRLSIEIKEVEDDKEKKGSALEEKAKADEYSRKILEQHDKYRSLVRSVFEGSDIMNASFRRAFESIMGAELAGVSTSELLAGFCDALLRRRYRDIDDVAFDKFVDNLIACYAYLSNKDLFISFYQNGLARRLLSTTPTDDVEAGVLLKFKEKYGSSLTSRMEGMLQDRVVSMEYNERFSEWLRGAGSNHAFSFGFSCQVLRNGCWPQFEPSTLTPSAEVMSAMEAFTQFYKTIRDRAILTYKHSLGQVVLKVNFTKGDKEVTMSPEQACICLLFNDSATLTLDAVATALSLQIDTVKRNISAMTDSQYKVFSRTGDAYSFNAGFWTAARKFVLPAVRTKSTKDERASVAKNVQEDRKFVTDAIIVRVMKSKRRLRYQELLQETMRHCGARFAAEVRLTKACVESLIEREYLERDPQDSDFLLYKA
eukprot:ANDGO_04496.mRNA.1 Cullin-1